MGFLWVGLGIAISSSQITALTNRSKPRNLVLNEFKLNPNISVDEISSNTGNILNDTQAIILDLKTSGRLVGNFYPITG